MGESQGYLIPAQIKEYIAAVRQAVNIPVGFLAHNNLGLAIGNSLAAIDAGAAYTDGNIEDLGGGSGNAQT